MSSARVSVITVCLNVRDVIRLTLESVKRQSILVDHILIDGGSTDGTLDIIAEYEVAYLSSKKDEGVYDAMEKARAQATGEFTIFLNAGDSFFDDDVCRDVAAFFDRSGADIVFGNLMPVYLNAGDTHDHSAFTAGVMIYGNTLRDLPQICDQSIHHQATFYRVDLLQKVSYVCEAPEGTGEYNLLLDAIFNQKASVKYFDRPISRFALGGISTANFGEEWDRYRRGVDALHRIYFANGRPEGGKDFFHFDDPEKMQQTSLPATAASAQPMQFWKRTLRALIRRSVFFRIYKRVVADASYRSFSQNALPQVQMIEARTTAALTYYLQRQTDWIATQFEATRVAVEQDLAITRQTVETLRNDLSASRHEVAVLCYKLDHAYSRLARLGADVLARLPAPESFEQAGFGVYSQFDEDGLIDYLVEQLPGIPPYFVEIGCSAYIEANTRFLAENRNWRGTIVDGNPADIETARHSPTHWRLGLKAICAVVDADNVDGICSRHAPGRDIGLLSIDVDGIDYWLWEKVESVSPWIVITEFNAIYGPEAAVTVPYQPDFDRTKAHYTWLYAGASIGAFRHLAERKGYTLVGVNAAGNNAFWVRDDLVEKYALKPVKYSFRRPNFREARNPDGSLSMHFIEDAVELIEDMELIDVRTGKSTTVGAVTSVRC